MLWLALRSNQLGVQFRRQVQIGRINVDFVSYDCHLIVEIDGGQQAALADADCQRDVWLRSQGFEVVRFGNHQVLNELDAVVAAIRGHVREWQNHPQPASIV